MVGEQIGLDEGAIFESLREPVWTKTVVKYRHNKDGKLTSKTTTRKSITGSQALLLILGGVGLGLFAGLFPKLDIGDVGDVENWFEEEIEKGSFGPTWNDLRDWMRGIFS